MKTGALSGCEENFQFSSLMRRCISWENIFFVFSFNYIMTCSITIEEINKRKTHKMINFKGCESLSGHTFSGKEFGNCTFDNVSLDDSVFTNCKIDSCSFKNSKISNSDFTNAKITDTEFTESSGENSNFVNAILSHSTLDEANFSNSNFTDANLSGCGLYNSNFSYSIFERANLSKAKMIITRFINTNLKSANLSESILNTAFFEGADLTDANLDGADLTDANLVQAKLLNASLVGAILDDAEFHGANLKNAILKRANLKRANLSHTSLINANFIETNLNKAKLSGANLSEATFIKSNLTDANLTNANLTYTDFTGANLTNADFTDSNLTNANFTGANLTNAIFTDANLTYTNFTDANLTRTIDLELSNLQLAEQDSIIGKSNTLLNQVAKVEARHLQESEIKTIKNTFSDKVFDISLAMEIPVSEIDHNEDNIIFYIDNQPNGILYPREQLFYAYYEHSSIFVGCNRNSSSAVPISIVKPNSVYVRINLTTTIFVNNVDMLQLLSSLHRIWYIQETEQKETITASILNVYRDDMPGHNIFNDGMNIVSGDHCQDGTAQKVSTLTPIRFEQSRSINTKHSANESQKTGGRMKKNKSVVLKSKVKRNETRKKKRRLTKRRRQINPR